MADAKLTKRQQDQSRQHIQRKTTGLIERLAKFAAGENDAQGNPVQMSQAQVNAGLGLIKKVLPDQQHIEHEDAPQVFSKVEIDALLREEVIRLAKDEPDKIMAFIREASETPTELPPVPIKGSETQH